MVLSERLAAIASFVKEGQSVADIGTDHAYLPIYLMEHAISPKVVITDVAKGPLAIAMENLRAAGIPFFESEISEGGGSDSERGAMLRPRVLLRQGDGLACVDQGETDICVIAGMGGELIIKILDAEPAKARAFGRLIFQPRTKSNELRSYLSAHGFSITGEKLAKERNRICEVFVAEPVSMPSDSEENIAFESDPEIPNAIHVNKDCGDASPQKPGLLSREEDKQIALLEQSKDPLLMTFLGQKLRCEEKIIAQTAEESGEIAREKYTAAKARANIIQTIIIFLDSGLSYN